MSDTIDPMEPIVQLARRLGDEAVKLGLEMAGFSIIPNLEGGPHHLQAAFTIDADKLGTDAAAVAEQSDIDDRFADLAKQFAADERRSAEDEAKAQMEERLKRGRGILDDKGETDG